MDYKGGQYMPDCQCKSNILNNFSLESTPAQGGQYVPDYPAFKDQGFQSVHCIDPVDDWLEKRIKSGAEKFDLKLSMYSSPMFMNAREDLADFFKPGKKKFFQTEFYIQQRKKHNILLETDGKPLGGKWSFDAENRLKYPKDKKSPTVNFPASDDIYREAVDYVNRHFPDNPGILSENPIYPINFTSSREWLRQFLETRFFDFGPYEDAIVQRESFLHHSLLTPMLNVGLITPKQIIDKTLEYASTHEIPLNSLEGLIRQITGWREFIRGIYVFRGIRQRTTNFFGFTRKIPASFYDGSSGIVPLDLTIKKVVRTGYCHHIERLMVLGNFMLLCEFNPDEVYRWFMELFIDAYDWVMVPNIYGMSQFADGGLMASKPYISGSNYLMKMSDYEKGKWQQVWDALFWRFMHIHRDFFLSNPRLGMLVRSFDKMPEQKQTQLISRANHFLEKLSK
jgi:deoxyribodipyrimidine photolyase-related protein